MDQWQKYRDWNAQERRDEAGDRERRRADVAYLAGELLDLMYESCPECGVGIGDHVVACPLRDLHRALKAWSAASDALPGEGA